MKKRVNITISDELLAKVDSKCKEMGINRSSYICNKVATAIAQEELTMQGMIAAAKDIMLKNYNDEIKTSNVKSVDASLKAINDNDSD